MLSKRPDIQLEILTSRRIINTITGRRTRSF